MLARLEEEFCASDGQELTVIRTSFRRNVHHSAGHYTMHELNATHDPGLTSWVDSANRVDSDFPIQNLPFGVFRREETYEAFRVGVAIGDQILDIGAAHANGAFAGEAARAAAACTAPSLNAFMALGPDTWAALRLALSRALGSDSPKSDKLRACLVAQSSAQYCVPAQIGDYTDFYTSIHHATNVGRLFRPDNPLLPNYKWVPIGYHGRSSTIEVSGQAFARPVGQTMPPGSERPKFGNSHHAQKRPTPSPMSAAPSCGTRQSALGLRLEVTTEASFLDPNLVRCVCVYGTYIQIP